MSLARYAALLAGVFACSTSVIWIKGSTLHPAVIAALRLAIAAVVLAPVAWRELRRHRGSFAPSHLWRTTLPAAVLALHFISWNHGAQITLSAQATLLVNLVPVAMPFFLWWSAGERVTRIELLGTLLAVAGVLVFGLRDALAPGGNAAGTAVCFASMLLFAWYLALGRRNRDFPSIWLYVTPLYAQAAVFAALVSLPVLDLPALGRPREWLLLAGLAVVPTIAGHSLLNAAMRRVRGQVVGLVNTAQFVFAGAMALVIFGEIPPPVFYAASALVAAGVFVVVWQPREMPAAE
jgi:drug/metabolite transporter (DMT)-like permease